MDSAMETTLSIGGLKLTRTGYIASDPDQKKWMIEGLWAEHGTGIIGADPGHGKTYWLCQVSISLCTGIPFLGRFQVSKPGSVLLYSPEGNKKDLEERICQLAKRLGREQRELPIYIIEKEKLRLDVTADQEDITKAVEKVRPKAIIFDPLIECINGRDGMTDDMKVVTNYVTWLRNKYSCAVMIAHHKNKEGKGLRGAVVLNAFGDSYVYLEKPTEQGNLVKMWTGKQRVSNKPVNLSLMLNEDENGNCGYSISEHEETASPGRLEERMHEYLKANKNTAFSRRKLQEILKGDWHKYKTAIEHLVYMGVAKKESGGIIYKEEPKKRGPKKKKTQKKASKA